MSSCGSATANSGSIFFARRTCRKNSGRRCCRSIDKSEREPREKTAATTWPAGRAGFQDSRWRRQERETGSARRRAAGSRPGRFREDRSRDRARACLLFRRRLRGVRSRRKTARARRRRPLRQPDPAAQRRRGLAARARLCHGRRRSRRIDRRNPGRQSEDGRSHRRSNRTSTSTSSSRRKSAAPMRSRRSRRCATAAIASIIR